MRNLLLIALAAAAMVQAAVEVPSGAHVLLQMVNSVDTKTAREGDSWTLKADSPTATNSITDPEKIIPVETPVRGLGKTFTHTFPPYSITILQFAATPAAHR